MAQSRSAGTGPFFWSGFDLGGCRKCSGPVRHIRREHVRSMIAPLFFARIRYRACSDGLVRFREDWAAFLACRKCQLPGSRMSRGEFLKTHTFIHIRLAVLAGAFILSPTLPAATPPYFRTPGYIERSGSIPAGQTAGLPLFNRFGSGARRRSANSNTSMFRISAAKWLCAPIR